MALRRNSPLSIRTKDDKTEKTQLLWGIHICLLCKTEKSRFRNIEIAEKGIRK